MKKATLYWILMSLYLLLMSIYFVKKQYYNWDLEAYMGLAYRIAQSDLSIDEVHSRVYEEIRAVAPEKFDTEAANCESGGAEGGDQYYPVLAKNPQTYGEELELFTVKPVYNWWNAGLVKMGVPAIVAVYSSSVVSFVILFALIFNFLTTVLKNSGISLVITVLLTLFKPVQDATRHISPDMLGTLLMVLTVYYTVWKPRLCPALTFAVLSVGVRPEFVVFYGIWLILHAIIQQSKNQRRQCVTMLTGVLITFAVIQFFNKVSWQTLVTNQFLKVQYYPVSRPEAFDMSAYVQYLKSNILLQFNSSYFPLLTLFVVILMYFKQAFFVVNKQELLTYGSFIFSILTAVFIRYLIFPTLVNRMMVGYYLLMILATITFLWQGRQSSHSLKIE